MVTGYWYIVLHIYAFYRLLGYFMMLDEGVDNNTLGQKPDSQVRPFPWDELFTGVALNGMMWAIFIFTGLVGVQLSLILTIAGFGIWSLYSLKNGYDWISENGSPDDNVIQKISKLVGNVVLGVLLVAVFVLLSLVTEGFFPLFLVTPIAIVCWALAIHFISKDNFVSQSELIADVDLNNANRSWFYNTVCCYFPTLVTFLFTTINVCCAAFSLTGGMSVLFNWVDLLINNLTFGFVILCMFAFEIAKFAKIQADCSQYEKATAGVILNLSALNLMVNFGMFASIILAAIAVSNPAVLALSPIVFWSLTAVLKIVSVVLEKVREHYTPIKPEANGFDLKNMSALKTSSVLNFVYGAGSKIACAADSVRGHIVGLFSTGSKSMENQASLENGYMPLTPELVEISDLDDETQPSWESGAKKEEATSKIYSAVNSVYTSVVGFFASKPSPCVNMQEMQDRSEPSSTSLNNS